MSRRVTCPGCGLELEVHSTTAIRLTAGPQARHTLLVEQVVAIIHSHGPISANGVTGLAHRRKPAVRAALGDAEAAGRIHRDDAGRWTR